MLIRDWIAVDRIRLPKHTGRLGSLRVGDRFLYCDSVFMVVSSETLSASETETRSLLHLIDTGALPLVHWELVVHATSQPRITLTGILRRREEDNGHEDTITDSDIIILKPCTIIPSTVHD
jgi:hypothetical protein